MQNKKFLFINKKIILILVLIVVIVFILTIYFASKKGYLFRFTENKNEQQTTTTSDLPSAQPEFTSDDEREPGNSNSENKGSSDITDNYGQITVKNNDPLSSETGEIVVYSPIKNSVIKKGEEISGTSSLEYVEYRVIDDISGLIANGRLKVVSGKFSGTIDFETSAINGRLDLYGVKADTSEFSNVEVPIRFK